jgi:polysaccharide export outer membrane protein
MSSCLRTQQVSYFSNAEDTTLITRTEEAEPLIQKNDILSIYISSLNAEASAVFNAPNSQATSSTTSTGSNAGTGGYLVNQEGNIQLPILGNIKASGITKKQLKEDITNQILDKKLLLDPIVTIRHMNYEVTVIGEVGKPTVINVPNEKISLLKALGIAGDITVFGKKDNVLLIREIEGKRKVKRINLNSKNFLTSSYYYLQPNDVVYVEPNKQKAQSANSNQQLVIALVSGVATIVAVVVSQLLVK